MNFTKMKLLKANQKLMADGKRQINQQPAAGQLEITPVTGIQLLADILATSPHHFLVFCHIFARFWRKIKVNIDLESGESCASI
jgi:hypothetical protein